MKNIPTWKEVKNYLLNGKKIIYATMGIIVVLFSLLYAYNIYANYQQLREEDEEYLSQDEITTITESDPEEITVEQLNEVEEALAQDRYLFSVLIEREDQSIYNYPELIREFLISDEVVRYVEEETGRPLLPNPEMAVVVEEDSSTHLQKIIIGTGSEEDNSAFALAYYNALQEEGLVTALENKDVYLMDEEPYIEQVETWYDVVFEQIQVFSPLKAILVLITALLFGFILGILIVLVRTVYQKEIPFLYSLEHDKTDKILYFNQLKAVSNDEMKQKLTHAIMPTGNKKTIVITQKIINNELLETLSKFEATENNSISMPLFVKDVDEIDPNYSFEEVIILVKQNETTKAWYENQRIQLERFEVSVIILQY